MADPRDFKATYPDKDSTLDRITSKIPPVPWRGPVVNDESLRLQILTSLIELYKGNPPPDSKRIEFDLNMIYDFVKNKVKTVA